jgi:membrane-associated phospholipid phosphatase
VPPLLADIWTRRGFSLLWGASALTKVAPQEILSLHSLFRFAAKGFPAPLPSNGGKLLITTGLEGALDALAPDEAENWTVERIRPLMERFQEVWDGEGALGFWLPSGHARIVSRPAGAAYDWRLPTGHGEKTLPLGELIFAGADDDLQPIMDGNSDRAAAWIGLYHPRVS